MLMQWNSNKAMSIWLGFSPFKTRNTTRLALTHTALFYALHKWGKRRSNLQKLTAQHTFTACVPPQAWDAFEFQSHSLSQFWATTANITLIIENLVVPHPWAKVLYKSSEKYCCSFNDDSKKYTTIHSLL
jgi:hypothetical protein